MPDRTIIACPECGATSWWRTVDRSSTSRQRMNFEGGSFDVWGTESLLGEDVTDVSNWVCTNDHSAVAELQDKLETISMDVDFVP